MLGFLLPLSYIIKKKKSIGLHYNPIYEWCNKISFVLRRIYLLEKDKKKDQSLDFVHSTVFGNDIK